ncbi:hypothetical protein [Roseimaritima ulvae]|uniref:Uncharacterized protein n=1 Tax=Roseimaritima ulvae TaxID=980254 RepID=A0A5B9QYA7_9BACT|nr:hypothetical protein [Roseimaritima ulvae]QEG38923.1 hypothetical protein UC8_08820 [Roseimaritima ulvae]
MPSENPYQPPDPETPLAVAPTVGQPAVGGVGWWWVLGASVIAAIAGVVGRLVRPLISGPVHYEAIVGLVLMILVCVVLLVRFRKFPRPQGIFFYLTGTLAIWAAHVGGWMIAHGEIWADVVWVNLACNAVAALVGCVTLFLPRSGRQPHFPPS